MPAEQPEQLEPVKPDDKIGAAAFAAFKAGYLACHVDCLDVLSRDDTPTENILALDVFLKARAARLDAVWKEFEEMTLAELRKRAEAARGDSPPVA